MEGETQTAQGLTSNDSEVSLADSAEDDNELALRGIVLLLNNKWEESESLFEKYRAQSTIMHFGGVFVMYLRAMMSLEDEKVAVCLKALEDVEKKCDTRTSLLKKIKRKLKNQSATPTISLEDKWMSQIIVADSLLYQAILTFINQEIPSYLKGGWLLRKAWKVYDKVHTDIKKHYEQSKKGGTVTVTVELPTEPLAEGDSNSQEQEPVNTNITEGAAVTETKISETMTSATLARLLGAVRYGYGLFQLGLSMIPDKVLKLIEFLGFEVNREEGLKALEFCSESSDLRGPLAVLALLWYHTIMKPFFANSNELSGDEMAESQFLINKYQKEYPESSMFLFFKGRLCRLQKNLDGALAEYELAKEYSNGQRELQNAAMFEKAWCNMMKLNYDISYPCFTKLLMDSKWSKCFYTYMQGLCAGCVGRIDEAYQTLKTVPELMKKKSNQIEAFVVRRSQQFKKIKLTEDICELLTLELVYMWNNIAQCNTEELEKMLAVCSQCARCISYIAIAGLVKMRSRGTMGDISSSAFFDSSNVLSQLQEKKFFHLRSLIEGSIHKQLGDQEFAIQCYKEALARHEGLKHDYHVAAHTLFELGMLYIQDEKTRAEGRKMLLKAKDGFKEYDFENRLNIRIRNVLKTLPSK